MNWKRIRETCFIGGALIVFYLILQNPEKVIGLLQMLAGMLSPFLLGVVFAFLLERPYSFFARRVFHTLQTSKYPFGRKLYTPLCVLTTYLSLGAALVLLGSFIAPQIVSSVRQVAERVPVFIENAQTWLGANQDAFILPDEAVAAINNWLSDLVSNLLSYLPRLFAAIPQITDMVKSFGGGVFNLFISLVASLYLLLEKDRMLNQLSRLNKAFLPEKVAVGLARAGVVTKDTFRSYVNGQLLDAVIVGLVSVLGLSVLGFPYAVLVGTLMGVTNVIPFFGPFIGAVPGFLIIATADPIKALWYILFVLVVQQVDGNIIVPRIVGDSIGLPPFWVLVSVTVGGGLLGLWGMVLGMPLFAAFYKLLGEMVRGRESKGTSGVGAQLYGDSLQEEEGEGAR